MKDRLFKKLEKVYNSLYGAVIFFTYKIIVKRKIRKIKKIEKLTKEEKDSIKKYWKSTYGKKIATNEFKWYKSKRKKIEPQIIPDVIWHSKIEPYFCNIQMEKGFSDKNYFETIIGPENSPSTLIRCINYQLLNGDYKPINVYNCIETMENIEETICKPSTESGGGRGIEFVKKSDVTPEKIEMLVEKYNGNFIIQRIIKQHRFFSDFNSNSINTIRVLSFLYEGRVHILSSFLRVGGEKNRVDNVSSGGAYIYISDDGYLDEKAITEDLKNRDLIEIRELPSKCEFRCKQVPKWNEIKEIIVQNHYKLPHFKLINWDIALDEDEIPIVIEYNLLDASASFHQLCCGPIFGDLTDKVLKEINNRLNIKNLK